MSMLSPDNLFQSCRALGEAAVDPSAWPAVMEHICDALGAAGAVLVQTDEHTLDIPRTRSIEETADRYFHGGWHVRDTRFDRGMQLLRQGTRIVIDDDIFAEDELGVDPFLNEFYFNQGYSSAASVAFNAGPALWALSLHRTPKEGRFDARDVKLLSGLPDRLSEAATLSTAVGRVALTSTVNALGLVHGPAIAIDRSGNVLDANSDVDAIFDDDLNIRNRRLTTTDRQAANSLQVLIDRFLATREDAPLVVKPIVVRRTDRKPVVITTLPIPPAARNPFLGARALLTFTVIGERAQLPQCVLRHAFSLTPAEARLAALVADGMSTAEAATQLGIKRETVRNQLKAIFAKTHTNRQPELVALFASLQMCRSDG